MSMFIDQAEVSSKNYHFLCAALQQEYQVRYLQHPNVKYLLDFSPYTSRRPDLRLPPWVCELSLRPSADGIVDAAELKKLHDEMNKRPCHYGTVGVLGHVFQGDGGGFFDVILAYNGPRGTCGNRKWDRVFDRMKAQGYKQSLVPCMVRVLICLLFLDLKVCALVFRIKTRLPRREMPIQSH